MLSRLENAPRFLERLMGHGKTTGFRKESLESLERQTILQWVELMYTREFETDYGLSIGRYGPYKGHYYTFSPGKEGSILFIDADRDKGERYAVFPRGMQGFYFLKTVNRVGTSNGADPHAWDIVTGDEKEKGMKEAYRGFREAKAHRGESYWRGRMPDREEVLGAISSQHK